MVIMKPITSMIPASKALCARNIPRYLYMYQKEIEKVSFTQHAHVMS